MDTEHAQRLEVAARAVGMDVWTWDGARRAVVLDPATAGRHPMDSPIGVDDWVQELSFDDRDRARSWLLDLCREKSSREVSVHTTDGQRRRWICADVVGAQCTVAELTVPTAEERIRRSHQDFVYAVSHDLQEPLRMVSGYAEMIDARHGDVLPDEAREHFGFVRDGAQHLKNMLLALLEISRVETRGGAFEAVDLGSLVSEVVADLELAVEESDATIDVQPLPRVRGDEKQLFRLFHALFDNALRFHRDEPPALRITATEDDAHEIRVANRGIAIPESQSERIFRPFARLHPREDFPGIGAGLAIAHRIAERHGGTLHFEAQPEGWNHFVLRLPRS